MSNEGIIGWITKNLDKKDKVKVKKFLDLVAENFEVEREGLIDAVTAISGSGPAYFFLLCDSLLKTAIRFGFKPKQAELLVIKTLLGAGAIKKNNADVPYDELIKKITSKKGTTEAALKYFSKKSFSGIVENAAKEAYNRAKEISHE
jgi:pyrroline-5-carboxylate reductase